MLKCKHHWVCVREKMDEQFGVVRDVFSFHKVAQDLKSSYSFFCSDQAEFWSLIFRLFEDSIKSVTELRFWAKMLFRGKRWCISPGYVPPHFLTWPLLCCWSSAKNLRELKAIMSASYPRSLSVSLAEWSGQLSHFSVQTELDCLRLWLLLPLKLSWRAVDWG